MLIKILEYRLLGGNPKIATMQGWETGFSLFSGFFLLFPGFLNGQNFKQKLFYKVFLPFKKPENTGKKRERTGKTGEKGKIRFPIPAW